MSENQTTFRCAECGAIWRTELQRDLCCTARPEPVQQPTPEDRAAHALWDEVRPMLGWPQNAVTWERMAEHGRRIWRDRAARLKEAFQ